MLYGIAGLFAPARATERIIEELTLEQLQALANYDGSLPYHEPLVRALVWELKYRANAHARELAGAYLSEMLLAETEDTIGTLLLVPVPMHAARRKARGHNQTELLCEAALHAIGGGKILQKNSLAVRTISFLRNRGMLPEDFFSEFFSYRPYTLTRTVDTKTQQGLERHERLQNVKGSMIVKNPAEVAGRVCIVVDDVSTTGATFAEAKRALKAAGASEVRCIALAQS